MGQPRRRSAPRRRGDAAAADMVGTMLLVLAVVVLGGAVAAVVGAAVSRPFAPDASLALGGIEAGDASLRVTLRHGEAIPLGDLRVLLQRGDGPSGEVPRASWSTPDASRLRPGDALVLPLSPPAAAGETVRVRVARVEANALLAELAARSAPDASAVAPQAALLATLSPPALRADGASAALLEVRASHPGGAMMVAAMVADLSPVARAAGTGAENATLRDDGQGGDALGGDGTWSALVRLPSTTPNGAYVVLVRATDAQGRAAGETTATLVAAGGTQASTGTTFVIPSSANVTQMRLRNFTLDRLNPARLDGDSVLLHATDGARSWSAYVAFEDVSGVPYATQLRVWNDTAETVYKPRNGTRLPLAGLDLDLLNPVGSLQWVRDAGAADPTVLYPAVGMGPGARLAVLRLGDDSRALDTGIQRLDVVVL